MLPSSGKKVIMRNLVKQYNMEKVIKELGSLEGKNIMVNDTWLAKVKDIAIEYIPINDSIPEEEKDGSEENIIQITFNFLEGRVSVSFCPEREVCEIWHETDDLLVFSIRETARYVENEKDRLDFMLKEYNEYMNK
jgi:hypothetical protein